ncbi:carboxymuconolactone decarboxylase family protein [Kribbella sp. NPDC050124]|uniref:carboxymuconolactone decarboxylase family protein n=1 Tax=Kribbella sp. NPDC050124 TaxID=3364114 RepID=UPI0037995528
MTQPAQVTDESAEECSAQLAVVARYQPGIRARFEQRARLDPAFAHAWLRYAARLLGRPTLDPRTRLLVMTGQFTMSRRYERLRETVQAAIAESVDLKEVLEVIFQCAIYGGEPLVDEALSIFTDELEKADRLDELCSRGLQVGQRASERDLDEERSRWHPEDAADPRADALLAKYGWQGISSALVLRPRHTLDNAEFLGSLDEGFTKAFYDLGYDDMYGRLVLDHRTRLLCMVGNTLAIGEIVQTRHHMRTAIRQGASPREVLEVLFQSVLLVGHPNVVPERIRDLVAIVEDEGASF